jgi:hypothetical protein
MPVADDVVTYRLRIDLSGTEPPLRRELEVVSDLFLDELHWMIQVAFGREDCHLRQFTAGQGRNTEGTPDDEVRLDEVLVRPRDKLFGWAYRITLEAVLPRPASMPNARCVAGQPDRRAG